MNIDPLTEGKKGDDMSMPARSGIRNPSVDVSSMVTPKTPVMFMRPSVNATHLDRLTGLSCRKWIW